MSFWKEVRFFTPDEFDDPDFPGSNIHIDPLTVLLLDNLRDYTGWPIVTHNKHGVHGCVCMKTDHHSKNSFHNYDNVFGCSAVDFHFNIDVSPREQAAMVVKAGFTGIGIYQDQWRWPQKSGKKNTILSIGFHVDRRPDFQIWKRENGKYIYLMK